jgi:RNA polymerase sigma factor (sigma-70 family)
MALSGGSSTTVILGLSAEDAADVAQDTLAGFVEQYRAGKYDRGRGRLRAWLIGMVKSHTALLKRAHARRRERRGASVLAHLADGAGLEDALHDAWEQERKMSLLRQALIELKAQTRTSEKTLRAFELYVIKGKQAQAVAEELGLTPRDVYMAKNRVAERLRDIVARLDELLDDG